MAITIESEPAGYSPVTNPIEYEFSSTNSGQQGFSFYVELTINGSVHSYHDIYVESSDTGRFDISDLLRSFVSSSLSPTAVIEQNYDNSVVDYSIRVREKYGDPPILQGSYIAGSSLKGINGALRHIDWLTYDYTDYDATTQSATQAQWLTEFPYATESYFCGLNESMFLSILCTDTSADIHIELFDITGSSIVAMFQAVTIPSSDFMLLDVSPTTLIADTSLTTANFSTCYYYTVKLDATGAGGNAGESDTFTIYIDTACSQYTSRRLLWLNKFGGFESFSFTKFSEESTTVKFSRYTKNPGAWDENDAFVYSRSNGSNSVTSKTSSDTMTLNSDWVKQGKQNWLAKSLLESPIVLLEISHNVFEPVIVQTGSFKLRQRIKDGLIQEQYTIERTYSYKSQLG